MRAKVGLLCALFAQVSLAHEVLQRFGGYNDSEGEARSAAALGGELKYGSMAGGRLSSANYGMEASAETIRVDDINSDTYVKEHFPNGTRTNRGVSLNTTHTVQKLTDIRVNGQWKSDLVTSSKSGGAGVGHWWFDETLQTNIDVSRTQTDRPEASILDYDSETILLGPKVSSGGVTVSTRHLATPTTIWGVSWTRVEASDRPRLDAYGLNGRQFIPAFDGAIHGSIVRIINTGDVGTTSTTGSMVGWQAEAAVLKSLWSGANGRVGYRFVREDEYTRAFGDHLLYGADSFTLAVNQDLKRGVLIDRPVSLHAVASRYISNNGSAVLGEAGLTMKF